MASKELEVIVLINYFKDESDVLLILLNNFDFCK
jgi:hypothetical protein